MATPALPVWQYRLWSFQMGGTELERFLPKNKHTQRKLSNFENWVRGEQSVTKAVFLTLGRSRSSHFKKLGLRPKV